MRICDVCHDPAHQPVARASVQVRGIKSGALDICDTCLEVAHKAMSPARSAAAKVRRLQPWQPRELTDSEIGDEP
jgi:hypothetical protein